jgi:hypothetical protein
MCTVYVCIFIYVIYMCIACIAVCIYTHNTALMDLRRSELRQQEAAEAGSGSTTKHEPYENTKQKNEKQINILNIS